MSSSLLFLNNDARILDLIRRGDEESLVRLYHSSRKPVMSYILHNNGTPDDAEDMLQDALIVLWERVRSGRFEYAARLETFIVATVRNMWLRRLARRKRELPATAESGELASGEPSPLEDIIESEEAGLVQKALGKLGEQCRKLLVFYYWDELSMEEIASRLGFLNADTVKSKKYQCKKELQRIIGEIAPDHG